jgi:hypothetical protein
MSLKENLMTRIDRKNNPTWKSLAMGLSGGLLLWLSGWAGSALLGQNPNQPRAERAAVRKQTSNGADRERLLKELQPGITEDRVRELLGGPPNRMARQVLHLRFLEQWVYDTPFPVCVEIEHPRGRKPQLLTVHPLTSEKP